MRKKKRSLSRYLSHRKIFILPLFILFLFFFASSLTTPPRVIVSLETDKVEYQSADVMHVYIEVTSEEYLGEAFVRLHGIANRFGTEYVNEYRLIDLVPGTIQVNFSEALPVCSACSGLSSGAHMISSEVIIDDMVMGSTTKSIQIH